MFIPEKIKTAVSPENIIYNLEFEEALKKMICWVLTESCQLLKPEL